MHILICDDDAAFGTRMAEYVAAYFAARSILVQTAVCTSAGQALETPELELYQLAFLDVDMPGVNGMVLGRQLKQKCPGLKLVYVSAYLEFALEGYTVNAYRYLLKRDIVHTLPSCLDDLLAELTDQRKTLTVHHNRCCHRDPAGSDLLSGKRPAPDQRLWRHRPPAHLHLLRQNCRPAADAVRERLFAGEPQRCGQHEICVRHPQL